MKRKSKTIFFKILSYIIFSYGIYILVFKSGFYYINCYDEKGVVIQKIFFALDKESFLSKKNIDKISNRLLKKKDEGEKYTVFYDEYGASIYENKNIELRLENKKYFVFTNFSENIKDVLEKVGANEQPYIMKNGKVLKLKNYFASSFLLNGASIYFPKRLTIVFKNNQYSFYYYSFYSYENIKKMIMKKLYYDLRKEGIKNIKNIEFVDITEGFMPVGLGQNFPPKIGVNIEYIYRVVEDLKYTTKVVYSDRLKQGQQKILKNGKMGKIEKIYSVLMDFEGNKNFELISQKTLEYPESKVVEIGIAPIDSLKGKYYIMESSGYTSGVGEVGYYTSTGHRVKRGIAAVDPSIIPLGTKLYVEGYGYALALDTGSSIKGFKIDLYFESLEEALNWGRKKVRVYILK